MKLPLLVALALLTSGCLGLGAKDEPQGTTGDDIDTAAVDEGSETTQAAPPAPTAKPQPAQGANNTPPARAPAAPAAPAAPPAPPRIDALFWNGTITGAGASPPAGPACCLWRTSDNAPGQSGSFDVPAGLKGIVVELSWAHEQFDLDLQVLAADYAETIPPEPNGAETSFSSGHTWAATDGSTGQPDGLARIVVTDADALAITGGWSWRIGAETAQDAAYTIAVSLFFDAAPADGYSALASLSDNP